VPIGALLVAKNFYAFELIIESSQGTSNYWGMVPNGLFFNFNKEE